MNTFKFRGVVVEFTESNDVVKKVFTNIDNYNEYVTDLTKRGVSFRCFTSSCSFAGDSVPEANDGLFKKVPAKDFAKDLVSRLGNEHLDIENMNNHFDEAVKRIEMSDWSDEEAMNVVTDLVNMADELEVKHDDVEKLAENYTEKLRVLDKQRAEMLATRDAYLANVDDFACLIDYIDAVNGIIMDVYGIEDCPDEDEAREEEEGLDMSRIIKALHHYENALKKLDEACEGEGCECDGDCKCDGGCKCDGDCKCKKSCNMAAKFKSLLAGEEITSKDIDKMADFIAGLIMDFEKGKK